DGLNAHEHGDAPPQWLINWFAGLGPDSRAVFGDGVIYGGDEATPGENMMKPQAFKGVAFTLQTTGGPVDIYLRVHAQTNPMGHMARFHSFESYLRDPSGNVSIMQGWLDYGTGDSAGPQSYPKNCGE